MKLQEIAADFLFLILGDTSEPTKYGLRILYLLELAQKSGVAGLEKEGTGFVIS
jgi:hypothetical protein